MELRYCCTGQGETEPPGAIFAKSNIGWGCLLCGAFLNSEKHRKTTNTRTFFLLNDPKCEVLCIWSQSGELVRKYFEVFFSRKRFALCFRTKTQHFTGKSPHGIEERSRFTRIPGRIHQNPLENSPDFLQNHHSLPQALQEDFPICSLSKSTT